MLAFCLECSLRIGNVNLFRAQVYDFCGNHYSKEFIQEIIVCLRKTMFLSKANVKNIKGFQMSGKVE